MVKPIETTYKGYRFRSRTEARWAIAFDTQLIEWEYEKEGFPLPCGWYLPDFWLPQVEMWAEVKGEMFTAEEEEKCAMLTHFTGYECLMLDGQPRDRGYDAIENITAYKDENGTEYVQAWDKMDYWPFYEKKYHLSEHRFFCMEAGDPNTNDWKHPAISAARAARFEHGESGIAK